MYGVSAAVGLAVFAVVYLASTFTGRLALESARQDKVWLSQQYRDAQREVIGLQAQGSGLLAQEFAREGAQELLRLPPDARNEGQ